MAESVILNIPQVAENQNNKYITVNNAVNFLEQAMNAKLAKTVSGTSDVALTDDECTRYHYYVVSGGSGNHNLVFQGEIGANNANRMFVVKNASSYVTTVKSDAAGTTVILPSGASAVIHQDHDDMVKLAEFDGLTTAPYDIGLYLAGLPEDGVECFKFVAVRAIDFADNFANSRGHCGVNPTATAAFDVLKNGSSIGSISISTSGVFTFNTTGAGTSLAAGDRLSLTTPSPQDATLENISIVFLGTRTL